MQAQPNNVAMIVAAAQQQGVPTNLALAVSYHESEGFNSCAGSDTGVKGPTQLTQRTARSLGYDRDINEQNIKGGMAVLKQAVNACGATNYSCLSARYNGSPRPGEQAGWARGVAAADKQLTSNPTLMAQACANSNGADCPAGSGSTPNNATPPTGAPTLNLPANVG
jgi:soluble lytic murein transglycosylase-like protein